MGMEVSPFWRETCESRGPALTHAHWDKCSDEAHPPAGHYPFQCCHCGAMDPAARAWLLGQRHVTQFNPPRKQETSKTTPPPVPLDVQQRLRDIGLIPVIAPDKPAMRPMERALPAAPDAALLTDHLHEQKHVTGSGPTGTPNGRGRGELTPRQQARLRAWAGWSRFLDQQEAANGR